MHQDALAGPDVGDTEQHVVRRDVVDRDRGGFLETHSVRNPEHLLRGRAHHIRVSSEMGQREHALTYRAPLRLSAERVDHPAAS
jgi:hypothetical protein